MRRKIVEESLETLASNTKLVRIALAGGFFHTLGTVLYLGYSMNNALVERFEAGIPIGDLAFLVISWIEKNSSFGLFLVLGIVILLGFGLIHPVGEAAMFGFLSGKTKTVRKSFFHGIDRFFPAFEFSMFHYSFTFFSFLIVVIRIWMMEIEGILIVQIVMGLWLLAVLATSAAWAYAKIFISVEGENLWDAMRKSADLARENLGATLSLLAREILLSLRYFVVTGIVLGLPLGILFLAKTLGLLGIVSEGLLIGLAVVLLLIASYINAMVEAFFACYRYRAREKFVRAEEE